MQLSRNFKLEEFTRTSTGYINIPTADDIAQLRFLVERILQPLRDAMRVPIIITSGYRSPEVNAAVGGAASSYHLIGAAADITFRGEHCDLYLECAYYLLRCWSHVDDSLCEIIWYRERHFLHVAALSGGRWTACKMAERR